MRTRQWLHVSGVMIALAAPPLVIFIFPTLSLLARNIDYFPQGYKTGLVLYVAAALWLAAGLLALALKRKGAATRLLFATYLLSAPVWFLHALLVHLTEWSLVTIVMIVAWLSVAFLLSRHPRTTLLHYSAVVAIALFVGTGLPAVTAMYEARADDREWRSRESDDRDSSLPNIYHLVFDEYQTDFFELLLDDRMRYDLRGFAFFPDTTVTYGRTAMSLASMFASQDYNYDVPAEEQIARAFHRSGSTLRALAAMGYHRTGWVHRTRAVGDPPALDDWLLQDELVEAHRLPGYSDLLLSMWLYSHAPLGISERFLPSHHYDQLTADIFLPDDAPPGSVVAMRELIRREASMAPMGRYTFAHLILPHFPNVLEADCTYIPGSRTGATEQAACANLLISEFVSKLRELDRLDDSIVIIQSDHGSWYKVIDGQVRRPEDQAYDSEQASTARSRALLLVHLPKSTFGQEESLHVIERPTLIEDVMPTIFETLDVAHEFSGDRISLLTSVPENRVRYYHWYDRGPEGGLVDGYMTRFTIQDGRAVYDRRIPIPDAGSSDP